MTNQELIDALRAEDPDAEVHFTYNYGDHWRTTVAPKVRRVEEGRVTYSEYHRMPKVVDEDDTRYDGGQRVVILYS
jgi:hypothetical protein